MTEDVTAGQGAVEIEMRVVAFKNRPGIGHIYVGGKLLFDGTGEDVNVGDVTVRVHIPFHSHFETPSLAAIWKEPT